MEKMVLVSLRVEPETIKEIEEATKNYPYYKKSDIMRKALELAAYMCSQGMTRKLCYFSPLYGDVVDKFEFEYHRDITKKKI